MSHIFLPDREGEAAEYLLMIGWLARDKKNCLEIIIRLFIKWRIKLLVFCNLIIHLHQTPAYLREIWQLYITVSLSDQDLLVVLPRIQTHTVDTFLIKKIQDAFQICFWLIKIYLTDLTDYCCTVSLEK